MARWLEGPPPRVGWWPASIHRLPNRYRYWDGSQWSINATKADQYRAEELAKVPDHPVMQSLIYWVNEPWLWPPRPRERKTPWESNPPARSPEPRPRQRGR